MSLTSLDRSGNTRNTAILTFENFTYQDKSLDLYCCLPRLSNMNLVRIRGLSPIKQSVNEGILMLKNCD